MKEKQCGRCKQILPLIEFHEDNELDGGFTYWCKKCIRLYGKPWWKQYPVELSSCERKVLIKKLYYEKYPEKRIAHNAIKRSKIVVGNECEYCGSMRHLRRHHPDYDKPLYIRTACQSCNNLFGSQSNSFDKFK